MVPPPQRGGIPSPEQIKSIISAAQELKQKGATEESDPEFARLLALLRVYNAYSKGLQAPLQPGPQHTEQQQQAQQSNGETNGTAPGAFSQDQLAALKNQIMAFRTLSANKPLPEYLTAALFGDDSAVSPAQSAPNDPLPQKIVDVTVAHDKAHPADPTKKGGIVHHGLSFSSASDPYSFLAKVRPGSQDLKARLVIPSILPVAPDPETLKKERERFLAARVQYRIKELESLPASLTNENGLKLKALIELKSLRLLEKQRKLRHDILTSVSSATTLATAIDRNAYKRMKRQSLREARQTEKQERSNRAERDMKERQKHLDFLSHILNHGKEFTACHRNQAGKAARLGASVARFHVNAAKEEEKRMQRISEERLKALKENDEEAYLKLIDKTKDTRITHLLAQTNEFLTTLTNAVNMQKRSVGEEVVPEQAAVPAAAAAPGEEVAPKDQEEAENLDYYNTAHKVHEIVTEQPSILVGGKLKEYQIKGLQWMVSLYNNRLNGILADEMGLGKTIQTLSLITYLIEKKKQPGPYLVIVPLSTMTNWVLEFEKWAPAVTKIVYKGGPAERKNLSNVVRAGNFNVLLTTFEYIIRDRPVLSKVKWVHMIIDEGHRMKNNNSKLSVTLMQYYHTRYRLILTGTPLQNNLPELWALLNFILPKIFNSVRTFDDWFNSPFSRETGQERIELNEEEQLLIIRRLHKVLRPFLLRRLKKDVEKDLPDKVETIIKCPMSALQLRLYEQIRNRKARFGAEGTARKKALNNLVMQFRKICNHPYVFDEVEDSINQSRMTDENLYRVAGKFELLDRILPKFKATGHRVLIFFQMTQIMNIMEDFLRWKGLSFLRLDGSTKADDRTSMLKVFNRAEDPPFAFLLSTRAGGLGLNLQTADTVIIFDSDWNPHQDLQAQDRAHRIGQTKEVRILRLITAKSIEENILARAQYKLDMDGKVIQAGKFDNKTTDNEREELLRALFGTEEDDVDEEDKEGKEMLDDQELNEIIARSNDELVMFNKMDAERHKAEEEQWRKSGQKGPIPPRLMQDNELPTIYLEDPELPDEADLPIEYGRGSRKRKDVVYDDGLNDNQFLVALDGGDLEGYIEKKRATKAVREERRQARIAKGESPSSDEEGGDKNGDSDEELPPQAFEGKSNKRARKPAKINDEADDEADDEAESEIREASPGKKQRKKASSKKKLFADVDPDAPETLDAAARKALTRVGEGLFRIVEELEIEDHEGFTRRQCELFVTLPDPVDYSDYYLLIKKPIAMDMISHRLHSTFYKDIGDFVADFLLMFDNAMKYNQEGSQVYNDALSLKEVFNVKLNELCPGGQLFINDVDRFAAEADQQASDRKRSREDRSEDETRPPLTGKKARVQESEEEGYEDGGDDDGDD